MLQKACKLLLQGCMSTSPHRVLENSAPAVLGAKSKAFAMTGIHKDDLVWISFHINSFSVIIHTQIANYDI